MALHKTHLLAIFLQLLELLLSTDLVELCHGIICMKQNTNSCALLATQWNVYIFSSYTRTLETRNASHIKLYFNTSERFHKPPKQNCWRKVKVTKGKRRYTSFVILLLLLYNRLHYNWLSQAIITYLEIIFDTAKVKEHQTVVIYLTKALVFFLFCQSLNW